MASKFGLPGGIPERRVRPIWDAIDSRQFKNALKLLTSLLSKFPNSPYALALKALVLERMGKSDEAFTVCVSAKDFLHKNDAVLMDDLTLSTLQIVFQRLDHLDLATSCYEYACGKFPNNLDLMIGLFNCYVREYSFVKQQQTAIKMYKIASEERFLLWAVCSIHLQVLCGDGGNKLLLLAEGLLKKHIASHSLHEPEALTVYISILEQQAKYGDALELLSGKLGSLFMIEVDKLRIQGRLLARAGDFTAASSVFEKVLESCPDNWECFLHYLGCVLDDDSSWCDRDGIDPLHPPKVAKCKFSHLTEEMFDSRIAVASTLVHKLISDTNNDALSLRCPYLANLEIERRKHLFGKENDDLLMKALIQYFVRFGHLACFSSDVEVFLQVLSNDKKIELLHHLKKNCDSTAMPKKVLGQSITLFKIQELIGVTSKLPASELQNSAVQMVKVFLKSLPLSKDLDPQESILGEDLLTLASSALVELFSRTKLLGYLLEAIMILEFGLCLRRYAWPYKIFLLHLYSYLDILSLAYEWYRSLDVKNILLESVSHHILPQMLQSPLWTDLSTLLKEYLKFMDDHLRESADLTFLAYRHRTYSKVIEFVQFKERLQHSNQYLVAKIETAILQLKQNADNIQQEECILERIRYGIDFLEISTDIRGKALTFNEDMHLRPWWTPSPEKNYLSDPSEEVSCGPQENLKEREERIGRIIKKRSLLPRMIYLSIQCASASVKENTEANGSLSHLDSFLELKLLLECYAKILGHSFSDATQLVLKASNKLELSEILESNIADWVNFAVFLNAWNLNAQEVLFPPGDDGCKISTFNIVHSFLKNHILEKVESMRGLICSPGGGLPLLVQLVTEPLSWHYLMIQSFIRSALPSGRKKKRSGASEQFKAPLSHAISDSIQFLSDVMREVIRWLRQEINRPEEENVEVILSSFERKGQKEGPGEVFQLLQTFASSCQNESELSSLLTDPIKDWSSMNFARKVVRGEDRTLSEFLCICESKLNSLSTMAKQMAQI